MAEPRWLDPEEQTIWRAYVLATRLLWGELERDMQRGAGMPLTYYEILSTLSEAESGALRMTELSTILQVSPSRLSHAISRLTEWGLVRREVCSSDRRGWIAVLTDEGLARVREAAPIHVESVRRHLFDRLTRSQIEQLGEIGQALLERDVDGIPQAEDPSPSAGRRVV
jgi:DNA-binding MarR family transcriptional regulator